MSVGGFTLADRLGARAVPCRVRGCSRTWLELANKALALGKPAVAPDDPTAGMCDPCRGKWKELKDAERPCERPGCEGKWTWPATAQLEAFAARRPPPKGLCAQCEARLESLASKELPCSVPGCTRVAVLSPKAQLLMVTGPDHPLCAECEKAANRLKDRVVACGINGCSRKWTFRAEEQLQFVAIGRPLDPPPRRMCDECRTEFGKLTDREVRCRTSGCKKTWTWSRSDQLDACVAGKPAPKASQRMCQSCFELFQTLKDVERPCRKAGCKGTWTDKRGAQLARLVRGKTGEPYPRYCQACEKELGELQDREIACKTEGCNGTWTWAREQQLAAGVKPPKMIEAEEAAEAAQRAEAAQAAAPGAEGGEAAAPGPAAGKGKNRKKKRRREPQPPERRCSACSEFLAGRKTQEIPCTQCATPIFWPPESQLQTHLGNWAAPSLCGACKRDATEAARKAAKEALRAQAIAAQPGAPAAPAEAAATSEPPASDGA